LHGGGQVHCPPRLAAVAALAIIPSDMGGFHGREAGAQ
jgi:hypothetical protein